MSLVDARLTLAHEASPRPTAVARWTTLELQYHGHAEAAGDVVRKTLASLDPRSSEEKSGEAHKHTHTHNAHIWEHVRGNAHAHTHTHTHRGGADRTILPGGVRG